MFTAAVLLAVWANRLAAGIGRADLDTTARVLEELCRRLEADSANDSQDSEADDPAGTTELVERTDPPEGGTGRQR